MLQTTTKVGISSGRTNDMSTSSRSGQHTRRRKSKDGVGGGGGGMASGLWCTSGQRSRDSSFDATSPFDDIPHLVRPPSATNPSGCSDSVTPPPQQLDDDDDDCSVLRKTESEDSGVHSGKEDASNSSSSSSSDHRPRRLPPSGHSSRPASASAVKPSQRNRDPAPVSNAGCSDVVPKSRLFRSFSSFSLKTFSLRRGGGKGKRQAEEGTPPENNTTSGSGMERKRIGGSLPGDDRLNLSNSTEEEETDRKLTHTTAQRLSRLGRSFRRRRSTDRVPVSATDVRNPDRCSESSSTASSSSSSSAFHQAVILYGTSSRGRRSSFKLSISAPSSFDSNGNPPSSAPERKSGPDHPAIPAQLSLPDGVRLVKIFKLEQYVANKWISGMVISDKNELVLVDLRSAYLVDDWGNLIRTIGSKGSDRLVEPIGVAAGPDGRLVFSDHAQQSVKVFTNRGNHVRTVTDFSLANIAGVACDRATGEIFVAGTDRKRIFVHRGGWSGSGGHTTRTVPKDGGPQSGQVAFKHPFSVAYNPVSGEIIVGDDYDQSVMGVTKEGKLAWRFCPPTQEGERQFFPSSVCVDQMGTIFVADLYNGKVCMLDAGGQLVRVLLSRDFGLSGNPGAIATDGKGHIFVADEERTVKVFRYRKIS